MIWRQSVQSCHQKLVILVKGKLSFLLTLVKLPELPRVAQRSPTTHPKRFSKFVLIDEFRPFRD